MHRGLPHGADERRGVRCDLLLRQLSTRIDYTDGWRESNGKVVISMFRAVFFGRTRRARRRIRPRPIAGRQTGTIAGTDDGGRARIRRGRL